MRRRFPLAAAALLAALSAPALAADSAPATDVPLRDGKVLHGTVLSTDEAGATVRGDGGKETRLAWADLAPLGVFRVRAALVKPDDGAARLGLAELASELGLWALSRAEYERALALRAIEPGPYAKAVADAEARAIATGIARAERAADLGDIAAALEAARGLKIEFAGAQDAHRVDELLAALDGRIATRQAEFDALQKDLEKALADADRLKEALARRTEAKRWMAAGDAAAAEARGMMPRGVVSRVRRSAEAADESYVKARRELGRLRRLLPKDGKDRAEAETLLETLDRAQFRLLYDAAKFFSDQRVFDTAEDFAARASYVDPVDPKLLELREELRGRRIHYRISDLTNARPH